MKNLFITVVIAFLLGMLLGRILAPTIEIEVYTEQDIYYIKGNRVTSESGRIDSTFGNKRKLKEFVSKLTVKDLKL